MENGSELTKQALSYLQILIDETTDTARHYIRWYFSDDFSSTLRPFVDETLDGNDILWSQFNPNHGSWQVIDEGYRGQVPASTFWCADTAEQELLIDIEKYLARLRSRLKILHMLHKTLEILDSTNPLV